MAALRDLSDWIKLTLGGDAPRVNSIVKLVRGAGLFASGGRGRNAPTMGPSDFATAIVCALTTAAPTKAAADVRSILDLRTLMVSVDTGVGDDFQTVWRLGREFPDADECGNRMLPPELSRCPETLGDALAMLAEHFMDNAASGVMDYDEISLRMTAEASVEILLFNPDWTHGWGTEDSGHQRFAWKLYFAHVKSVNYDPVRREVVTKIRASALRALGELAGGVNASS